MEKRKRGISPVIATVLLIALVIVIFLIVFLWFRGTLKPAVLKFGENIELACEKVSFSADYSGGKLDLSNNGDVPISGVKIKVSKKGGFTTEDINDVATGWNGLSKGKAFSSALDINIADVTEILVIPVLRGTSEDGEKDYVCDDRFGEVVYSVE